MRYFRILADYEVYRHPRLFDDPISIIGETIDQREFRYGRTFDAMPPLYVPDYVSGDTLAFNIGVSEMPVVTAEIARLIDSIAPDDTQQFPILTGNKEPGYTILNVIKSPFCLDEKLSKCRRFDEEGDYIPGRTSIYKEISYLVIDPVKVNGAKIFRLGGASIELICNEEIKELLKPIPNLGVKFQEIETSDNV